MAPLSRDERDRAAVRAAEASQHCMPGGLRQCRRRRFTATGLVAERLREGIVDSDRDLVRCADAGARAREREHRRADVVELLPERARRARLVAVGVTQLQLPGREVRVLERILDEIDRRQMAGHLPEQQRRRTRVGAQRRDRDDQLEGVPALDHELRSHERPVLEVEWRLELRLQGMCDALRLLLRSGRGEIERLDPGLQQLVDDLQRQRQARLAHERGAHALVSAYRQPQSVRDSRCIDFAIDREHGLRASGQAVGLRRPQFLLLWRDLKAVRTPR